MKLSRLFDQAYGRTSTLSNQPVAVQALGEIFPKFGMRFRDEQQRGRPGDSESPKPMLDLGIGQYFDCAPEIIEAGIASLRAGHTRYLTLEPLKEAIARNYREVHRASVRAPREVLLLGGARPGLAMGALAGIDPGDVVVVPDPDYIGLTHIASAVGARVVRAPLRKNGDGSLAPDLDVITDQAAAGARAVFLSNPNNPTGHSWSLEELKALSSLSERFGTLILVNEIYDRLVFQKQHHSYAAIGNLENSIIVGGTAKVYDMTGFGLGWIISSAENVSAFHDLLFLTHQAKPAATCQYAALAALTPPVRDRVAESSRARLLANAQATVSALDGFNGCRCILPDAGQFAFPWVGGDDLEIARFLKSEFQVQVVPGSIWGSQGVGHLRIALANSPSHQAEGLERLRAGLDAYQTA